jgi:hypothetical protein
VEVHPVELESSSQPICDPVRIAIFLIERMRSIKKTTPDQNITKDPEAISRRRRSVAEVWGEFLWGRLYCCVNADKAMCRPKLSRTLSSDFSTWFTLNPSSLS